ncbi:MAG: DsbA family protein [Parvibaculaceae bacterium]
MSRTLKTTLLAGFLAGGLVMPSVLSAQEFNEKQREELGQIVREYLLKNPEVLREAFQALEKKTQDAEAAAAQSAISQHAKEIFRGEGDLVAGNPDGKITMVEFFDYNCGYCKRSVPDITKLMEANKDLRLVFKEWPILGPGSTYAAKAAMASRKQGKYWEFHVALLSERSLDEEKVMKVAQGLGLDVEKLKADMQDSEIQKILDRNTKTAEALGIQGTPAFLVDDQLFPGAVGYDALTEAVAKVRDAGGCKVC